MRDRPRSEWKVVQRPELRIISDDLWERTQATRAEVRKATRPASALLGCACAPVEGPTGVGKTFLACALGQQACRQGHRVIYRRIPRLFPELTLAHGDGTYPTVLARFARVDVLILDDWGLIGLKDGQRQDLLEILDDRDGNRSTIITSQLPTDRWHEHLGDPTLADAILDRVVHRAHRLTLTGPSRRKSDGHGSSAPKGV